MALNWLKRIFQKGSPVERSKPLRISELEIWLEDRSSHPKFEKAVMEAYSRLVGLSRDLSRDLDSAKSAKPPDGISPRLLKAGLAARGSIAKQIEPLLDKMEPPKDPDFDRAVEFHSALVSHIERTLLKLGRAKRYASAVFPQELESINSDMVGISQALNDLGESLEMRQAERDGLAMSRDLLSQLKEDRSRMAALRSDLLVEEERLSGLRDLESDLHEREEAFVSSDEGLKIASLEVEFEAMITRRGDIEAEMAALVAPLNKAISRLMKQDSSDRLDLENRESLQKLSAAPWEAMDADIAGTLIELRSNVSHLGLKDKMEAKVISQIDHLLKSRLLEALSVSRSKLEEQIERCTSELEMAGQAEEKLKQEKADLMLRIERSNEEIAGLKTALSSIEERAFKEKEELSSWIEKMGGATLEDDLE